MQANNSGGRAVFLLEDRSEVLESTVDLLEAHRLETLGAREIEEGWDVLSNNARRIRVALIDKNIGVDPIAGLSFLERAKSSFSHIKYFLITAWDLEPEEKERIQKKDITVLEKSHVSGSRLVDVCSKGEFDQPQGQAAQSDEASHGMSCTDDPVVNTREELYEYRLRESTLRLENRKLTVAVSRFGSELVAQLNRESGDQESEILFGGRRLEQDDLIREISDMTEIGLSLIDAHLSVVSQLMNDKKRGWKRWLSFLGV